MKDKTFKDDAKHIVDLVFKIMHPEVSRNDLNLFEEYICFLLKSKYTSYVRGHQFLEIVKNLKENTKDG